MPVCVRKGLTSSPEITARQFVGPLTCLTLSGLLIDSSYRQSCEISIFSSGRPDLSLLTVSVPIVDSGLEGSSL